MNSQPSLNGLRVLNTRPKEQADYLSQQISALQGICIQCPALEIEATPSQWMDTLSVLHPIDQVLFISRNAVSYSMKQLCKHGVPWSRDTSIIAIGPSSAQELSRWGLDVTDLPCEAHSESLLMLDTLQQVAHQTIVLFKGIGGRTLIEQALRARGARVIPIEVYKRCLPQISSDIMRALWHDDGIDVVIITSEESLLNLFKMSPKAMHSWIKSKIFLVISSRLKDIAIAHGINQFILSQPSGIMDALLDFSAKRIIG